MDLIVEKTFSTPGIKFTEGKLSIDGKAISIHISDFLAPVHSEIQNRIKQQGANVDTLEFDIEYANSAAKRNIIEILKNIKHLNEVTNNKTQILWRYQEEDDFMKELGNDISSVIGLPFSYEEYTCI